MPSRRDGCSHYGTGNAEVMEGTSNACWQRVRTVMLAIRSTRASVNRYQTQLEGDGDLHQLTEAHHLSSEIRSRQVIVSRIREAIERLKQMCVEKRAALVKTAEEYTDKVSQSELNTRLVFLDLLSCATKMQLRTRRKYLVVYRQLTEARKRSLLKELAEIIDTVVRTNSVSTEKKKCVCSPHNCIYGVHLSIANLMESFATQKSVASIPLCINILRDGTRG